MAQLLFKRGNTASNDTYTGPLGSITMDTQARKLRIHDGTTEGGHTVSNMADIEALQGQIDGLEIANIDGLQDALDALAADKADKSTSVSAGSGLTGGGDLSANRTITLGTPGTVSGSSSNGVTNDGHTHAININKSDVGLSNVDNTSDANKPVSTAQQNALDDKVDVSEVGVSIAELVNGKVPLSQMDDTVLGQLNYVSAWNAATNTPTLSTTPENKGDYYVVDTAGTFDGKEYEVGDWIISNGTEWQKIDNTDSVSSVAGKKGAVTLNKGDVGLSNVDNTSDADKPVSTAQQTALNDKAPLDSPSLTGNPTAPTPDASNVSTTIATTQYVTDKIGSLSTGVTSVDTSAPIKDTGTASNPIIGIDNATTTSDGAMSSTDKSKLDGIESGAEVNTVDSVAGKTGNVSLAKGDVGLANVNNYGTATTTEASAGTATNKYTTPANVKTFVEDGEYTIDLGMF